MTDTPDMLPMQMREWRTKEIQRGPHPIGIQDGEFHRYLEASEDWVDPSTLEGSNIVGKATIRRLPAKGGPFDGTELPVPPGGAEVILPAAFGKEANLKGVVIYRRQGQFMVYVGQGDHTVQVEEDDDGPRLILP